MAEPFVHSDPVAQMRADMLHCAIEMSSAIHNLDAAISSMNRMTNYPDLAYDLVQSRRRIIADFKLYGQSMESQIADCNHPATWRNALRQVLNSIK